MEKIFKALVIFLALCMIAPIVVIFVISFGGDGYLRFPPRSLSFQWYQQLFGDRLWLRAFATSAIIATISCIITTTAGFMAAYVFSRRQFPGKEWLLAIVLLPMIVPNVIIAIALYFLSARAGLVGNIVWLALCHAMLAIPIVVIILLTTMRGLDHRLEWAAYSVGAGTWSTLRMIVIPLALPGIISSILFSFLASFDELIVSLFLVGVGTQTLPVRIWTSLLLNLEPIIAAVSVVLILLTIAILSLDTVVKRFSR